MRQNSTGEHSWRLFFFLFMLTRTSAFAQLPMLPPISTVVYMIRVSLITIDERDCWVSKGNRSSRCAYQTCHRHKLSRGWYRLSKKYWRIAPGILRGTFSGNHARAPLGLRTVLVAARRDWNVYVALLFAPLSFLWPKPNFNNSKGIRRSSQKEHLDSANKRQCCLSACVCPRLLQWDYWANLARL